MGCICHIREVNKEVEEIVKNDLRILACNGKNTFFGKTLGLEISVLSKVLKTGPVIEPDKLLVQRFNGSTGLTEIYIYI